MVCFKCGLFGKHQSHVMESIQECLSKLQAQKSDYRKYLERIGECAKRVEPEFRSLVEKELQE